MNRVLSSMASTKQIPTRHLLYNTKLAGSNKDATAVRRRACRFCARRVQWRHQDSFRLKCHPCKVNGAIDRVREPGPARASELTGGGGVLLASEVRSAHTEIERRP